MKWEMTSYLQTNVPGKLRLESNAIHKNFGVWFNLSKNYTSVLAMVQAQESTFLSQ